MIEVGVSHDGGFPSDQTPDPLQRTADLTSQIHESGNSDNVPVTTETA